MIKKIVVTVLLLTTGFLAGLAVYSFVQKDKIGLSLYPNGKNFAFTVTDDPDWNTLERIKPVYDLLLKLGFRTTIAVWIKEPVDIEGLPDQEEGYKRGDTIQRDDYLEYILKLKEEGFEIALHTASAGHDKREDTIQGYEEFKKRFGSYPKINIMHSKNRENIYWGENAFGSLVLKKAAKLYTKIRFGGEDVESPYFWGDICKERTKYVRMWGTTDINTLKFNPSMPYHNNAKPFVNYWFSFSDAYRGRYFKKLISDKNIDKLVRERGASIVYTHFACGFCEKQPNGTYALDEVIKAQLIKLSKEKDGWFVPASTLLDRLLAMKNITLYETDKALVVSNANDFSIQGVTLLTEPNRLLYNSIGTSFAANSEGEIVIGSLKPNQALALFKEKSIEHVKNSIPNKMESFMLRFRRIMIMIFSHRG